jgi:ribonuclease G
MRIDEVLVTALPGDRRAAALASGMLVRLAFDGDDEEIRIGDIMLGRVMRLAPWIGGAFVDLGSGLGGVLMHSDAPADRRLAEGEAVVVQVRREATGWKGPKLTARLPSLPDEAASAIAGGARPPCRLCRGPDAIPTLLRDAAEAGVRRVFVDDGATLSRLRAAIPEIAEAFEPWLEPSPLFASFGIDEAIDRALAPVSALPSGGRLTIEETEALTVIDVDTGAETGVSAGSAALSCDLEAAAAIGREVMLRDLAGVLVIDFVPLRRPAERARVLAALRNALAGDDRRLRIGGWTRLGLVELVRERRGPSLAQRLTADCPACDGRGRVVSARWAAGDALREVLAEARRTPAATPTLAAAPAILQALRGPLAAATGDVEGKLGGRLRLTASDALPARGFQLLAPTSGTRSGG